MIGVVDDEDGAGGAAGGSGEGSTAIPLANPRRRVRPSDRGIGAVAERWRIGRRWPGASEDTLGFMSETARVTLDKNGNVKVYTGSSSWAGGRDSVCPLQHQGRSPGQGDGSLGGYLLIPRGVGTFRSRSAATGGSAVVEASRKLKSQLLVKASEVTGMDAKSLDIRNGVLFYNSQPGTKTANAERHP